MRARMLLLLPTMLLLVTGCAHTGGGHVMVPASMIDEEIERQERLEREPFDGEREEPEDEVVSARIGTASFYARHFDGRVTASGATFDSDELTAAHRTLPFGTRVRVTNLANDASVVVTVTDRGPYARRRLIDVSRRAARELDFIADGTARVRVEVLR